MSTKNEVSDAENSPSESGSDEHANAEPLTNWKTIDQFILQVNKHPKVIAPVYANGRQQVPIEIVIRARDANGVVVNLTSTQLKSIRLIEYDTGSAVGNVSDTKDNRFIYQWPLTREDGTEVEEAAPTENDVPEVAAQSVTKYVHKNSLSGNWVAAEIISPSGAAFRTNTPNPSPGKFDSWVKLNGREPPVYAWDCFAMSDPHNAVTNSNFDVDVYYVRFTDANLRIVASINHRTSLARGAHYAWNKDSGRMEHLVIDKGAYRPMTRKSCRSDHEVTFTVDSRSEQATVVRIRDKIGKTCSNHSYQHGLVSYIDQHGNASKVMLRAASDGNTISLDNPYRADELEPQTDELDPPSDADPSLI